MDQRLPTDVLDYILRQLFDLRTLSAAVQVSKRLHGVYKARERSLRAAVARNEVGPVLPAALRLARIGLDTKMSWDDFNWQALSEESEYEIDWVLARELVANAKSVHELERFYSQAHKDHASTTSQLTASESHKFSRALYRLTLYFQLWTHEWVAHFDERQWDSEEEAENGEADDISAWHRTSDTMCDDQIAFLHAMAPDEDDRRELLAVYQFLRNDVQPWIGAAYESTVGLYGDHISLGDIHYMASAVSAMGRSSSRRLDYRHVDEHVVTRLAFPLERKLDIDVRATEPSLLLDEPALDAKCEKCDLPSGQKLFNKSNWHLVCGYLSRHEVLALGFKGNLLRNVVERRGLGDYFNASTYQLPLLLDELFERHESLGGGVTEDTWLCVACVRHVVEEEMMPWWLERKRDGGQTIPEDCYWGFNCRTQTHNPRHAQKLNHLCQQTRFTGPNNTNTT